MLHPATTGATVAGPIDLPIPDSLRQNIRFSRGDSADAWLDLAVSLSVDLAVGWSVNPVAILEGGAMSVVVLCQDSEGTSSVLKVPGNREMGLAESAALAIWDNGALPRLLATDLETGAFLMEHVASDGGTPGPAAIIELLARLHIPAGPGLDDLDIIIQDRVMGAAARFAGPAGETDRANLAAATALIARLQNTAVPAMVHGDFQAKNLLHGAGGPVAIDPLPAAGDPASDLGLWIGGGSAGPRARALWAFMATAADPVRLLAWTWAMTVLEYRPGKPGSEDAAEFIAGHRDAVDALTVAV